MAVKTKEKENSKKTQKPQKTNKEKTNIFKGMFGELKKVSWPTKKETFVYTVVVVVTVIVFTIMVGIYDVFLKTLIENLLAL
ncbi:MAG: preprotein translocase subunit SecE [Fusobacteria bacterium]|nr:MAG: preprotein translocase subunit SecE [Fusobacteriota bacterium]KAF0228449.1 MAG: preprotein translocase subunit [Fusobacteriota bacterium]